MVFKRAIRTSLRSKTGTCTNTVHRMHERNAFNFLPFFLLEVKQIQNHQRRLSQEHPMAVGERLRPPPEPVQPAAPVSSGPVSTTF